VGTIRVNAQGMVHNAPTSLWSPAIWGTEARDCFVAQLAFQEVNLTQYRLLATHPDAITVGDPLGSVQFGLAVGVRRFCSNCLVSVIITYSL